MLFDHDAKVSGDSARFADFLAAGGQPPGAVCVKDWAGWAIAASRTRKHAPAGRDLGELLAATPFSSDRAVLAPWCDFRAIRSVRSPRTNDRQRRRQRRLARAGPRTAPGRARQLWTGLSCSGIEPTSAQNEADRVRRIDLDRAPSVIGRGLVCR
jgi:hypothetical protein